MAKNHELINVIRAGTATPGELREYLRKLSCKKNLNICEQGHWDCALLEGGPCSREVQKRADALPAQANGGQGPRLPIYKG